MDAVFFPRNDYPTKVEVCAHRLGKKMTYTEQSDRMFYELNQNTPAGTTYNWIYGLSQLYGVKVGFFAIYTDFADTTHFPSAKESLKAGEIWIDQYSMAESISTKIRNLETITEQEFNYAYTNELLPAYYNAIGKKPVALSYAFGNTSFEDYVCPKYLGARNSKGNKDADIGKTDYGVGYGNPANIGYSAANFKSKGSSVRWYDRYKSSLSDGIDAVSDLIDATMLNGGWLNNFTHFHSVVDDGNQSTYEQYFQMLAQKNANNEIYFAGWGEAVGYLVYRQIITKAVMYSPALKPNDQLVIRLETVNSLSIDTDLLQVPISVKFSTVGTPLEGQSIKSSCHLVSLGGGEYIVEIPYAKYPVAIIEKVSI